MDKKNYWAVRSKQSQQTFWGLTERQIVLLFHLHICTELSQWSFKRSHEDAWLEFDKTKDKIFQAHPSWIQPVNDDLNG